MSYLPCINPSCKSYGKPHPNCRCYPEMAEGGEVGSFCSSNRSHDPKCHLYNDDVDSLLKNSVKPDPTHQVTGYLAGEGLSGLINLSEKYDPLKYQSSIDRGHKKIESHVDSLFDGKPVEKRDTTHKHKMIKDWLEKGGITHELQQEVYNQNATQAPPSFAEGGEVSKSIHSALAKEHPAQNILLNAAKGAISNYLQSLRPEKNHPKLAFDTNPDQTEKEKTYNKAITIADNPLSVLNEVHRGTQTDEHLNHLKSMYPDLNDHLQKKITEKITDHQLKDKKPHAHRRQSLSIFMGTPLSSEFTQPSIAAAQSTFVMSAPPPAPIQSPKKNKKSTSTLTKSSQSFLTNNQALTGRSQKQS